MLLRGAPHHNTPSHTTTPPPSTPATQERHRIHGWALELAHDFGRPAPVVGLSKRIGSVGRAAAVYDVADRTGHISLRLGGLVASAAMTRADGSGWKEWSSPSLTLTVEPLAFL